MNKRIVFPILLLVAVACHDSERYLPTSPDFQNALSVSPAEITLPADGFSTVAITATISPSADQANRIIEFITSEGSFVEQRAADKPKEAEKAVDASGNATVHLRSAGTAGSAEVTVRVKAKPELTKRIPVAFTAASASATMTLTAERTTASADDFTATVIIAQLSSSVPQSGRTIEFKTTQGKFLQGGTATATIVADQNGRARVDLVGPQTPATARVTATAFGITEELFIQFILALPDFILVKPAKLSVETGIGDAATTAVTIELYRTNGKVSIGVIPSLRIVDPTTGGELPFLIRNISPSTADGKSQAQITSGTTRVGTARIEARVEGSPAVGTATIEVVAPKPTPSAGTYTCWGDDGEDLTPIVDAVLKDDVVVILRSFAKNMPLRRPRILVTCSKDHENIFEIGTSGVGRRPTDAERPWIETMKELTPSKSFEAVEKHATFLFTNLTIFTTLLTGLSIASDFKVPLDRLWLIAIPVSLIALALMLAALAITPRVVAYGTQNLTALEETVKQRLRSSGKRIRIAGVLFALAIF